MTFSTIAVILDKLASVAQSVVHLTRNEKVACSSHVTSSTKTPGFASQPGVFLTFGRCFRRTNKLFSGLSTICLLMLTIFYLFVSFHIVIKRTISYEISYYIPENRENTKHLPEAVSSLR